MTYIDYLGERLADHPQAVEDMARLHYLVTHVWPVRDRRERSTRRAQIKAVRRG